MTAVAKCADDTKGQTCYICTQALHWKTKEGVVRGCSCRGTAGFAHVSCLAEQAKILREEAEYNNLGLEVFNERWGRWYTCSLCEQEYHGIVRCALGWACWKMYVGRPETDQVRRMAMTQLANGLSIADRHDDSLHVREAELSMHRRHGASQHIILTAQGNRAITYEMLGRLEDALEIKREVYIGRLKLSGKEDYDTIRESNNYADTLVRLERFEEAKSVLRKMMPAARRVLGENNEITLKMRAVYARSLYEDQAATLYDLRKAVTTLEETEETARRVLGAAHPTAMTIELDLRESREALSARDVGSITEAFAAMMTPSPRG